MDFRNEYIWGEEEFRVKNKIIVYKILSLKYEGIIAYIRVTQKGYEVFNSHTELSLETALQVFKLAETYRKQFQRIGENS